MGPSPHTRTAARICCPSVSPCAPSDCLESLLEHNAERSEEDFIARRIETNGQSIDGLAGLDG